MKRKTYCRICLGLWLLYFIPLSVAYRGESVRETAVRAGMVFTAAVSDAFFPRGRPPGEWVGDGVICLLLLTAIAVPMLRQTPHWAKFAGIAAMLLYIWMNIKTFSA